MTKSTGTVNKILIIVVAHKYILPINVAFWKCWKINKKLKIKKNGKTNNIDKPRACVLAGKNGTEHRLSSNIPCIMHSLGCSSSYLFCFSWTGHLILTLTDYDHPSWIKPVWEVSKASFSRDIAQPTKSCPSPTRGHSILASVHLEPERLAGPIRTTKR